MNEVRSHGFVLAPQPPLAVAAAYAYSDAALAASAAAFPDVLASRDIAWGAAPWQRFDIFTPPFKAGGAKLPVLVFFHGGGWLNGYKEWCGFMAPAVTALGAILVAPTYRLAPEYRFPVFLRDCVAALAAVHRNIADFDGDPARLFVAGHSAGGHLAAMAALRPEFAQSAGLPIDAILGVLPISGIHDLAHAAPPPGSLEEMVYQRVLARPEDDAAASPVTWVSQARAPFVLAWGEHDTERVRRSNIQMAQLMREANLPHEAHCYPGLDHFDTHLALRDPAHPWYAAFARVLETGR